MSSIYRDDITFVSFFSRLLPSVKTLILIQPLVTEVVIYTVNASTHACTLARSEIQKWSFNLSLIPRAILTIFTSMNMHLISSSCQSLNLCTNYCIPWSRQKIRTCIQAFRTFHPFIIFPKQKLTFTIIYTPLY